MARKNLLSRYRVASSLPNRRRFIGRGRNLEDARPLIKNNNRRLMSGHPISPEKDTSGRLLKVENNRKF